MRLIIKAQQIANKSILIIIIIWLLVVYQKYKDIEIQTDESKMSTLYDEYQKIGNGLTFFILGAIIINFIFVFIDILTKI